MKRLLLLTLLCAPVQAVTKRYVIECEHTIDTSDYTFQNSIVINGEQSKCWCGNDPIFVFIGYGEMEVFCLHHTQDLFSNHPIYHPQSKHTKITYE